MRYLKRMLVIGFILVLLHIIGVFLSVLAFNAPIHMGLVVFTGNMFLLFSSVVHSISKEIKNSIVDGVVSWELVLSNLDSNLEK